MYPVSDRWDDAVRNSHIKVTTAVHHDPIGGADTTLPALDGSFGDDATSNTRRQLQITLPGTEDLWEVLDTEGGEITCTQGFRYADDDEELIPMGVYIVDQERIDYAPGGQITMTCPDRWLKVQRNRFGLNRASVPSNAAWQEIVRLVEGAWPSGGFPGWASIDRSATEKVGSLLWDDGDREKAILDLCAAHSVQVLFDRNGLGVLRPVPYLSDTSVPVWTVDAGASGVMLSAGRTRDRSSIRNAWIITTSATDVTFPPVEVKNTVTGDPLNVTGPLGYVPGEWSSPSLRNSDQAAAAGRTKLRQSLGTAKQLSLTAVGNPALDSEDVIGALLPQIDPNTANPSELHILDTLNHPWAPSGTQDIATRSTVPAASSA